MADVRSIDRRRFLRLFSAAGAGLPLASAGTLACELERGRAGGPATVQPAPDVSTTKGSVQEKVDVLSSTIPSTGLEVPVIGMGTWITFDVGKDLRARAERTEVLRAFFEGGGGMIDSSPMYGSSEEVVGYCLEQLGMPPGLFSATKVWTRSTICGKIWVRRGAGSRIPI